MERLGLAASLLKQDIASLSGGEKQRVAILSDLLLDRPILLLDEASSALDAKSKQRVVEVMREMKDRTILSVSHDTEWLDFSDRVVTLPASPGGDADA
jgi:ABC-type lipoprotein export system ATPase subunit